MGIIVYPYHHEWLVAELIRRPPNPEPPLYTLGAQPLEPLVADPERSGHAPLEGVGAGMVTPG